METITYILFFLVALRISLKELIYPQMWDTESHQRLCIEFSANESDVIVRRKCDARRYPFLSDVVFTYVSIPPI